jgi:hypothetical protein
MTGATHKKGTKSVDKLGPTKMKRPRTCLPTANGTPRKQFKSIYIVKNPKKTRAGEFIAASEMLASVPHTSMPKQLAFSSNRRRRSRSKKGLTETSNGSREVSVESLEPKRRRKAAAKLTNKIVVLASDKHKKKSFTAARNSRDNSAEKQKKAKKPTQPEQSLSPAQNGD